MKAIFNNKAEINILLYFIILTLELIICLNIIIIIRDVNDKLSHIINYIPEVPIHIKDIIVYQSFFMLEHGFN